MGFGRGCLVWGELSRLACAGVCHRTPGLPRLCSFSPRTRKLMEELGQSSDRGVRVGIWTGNVLVGSGGQSGAHAWLFEQGAITAAVCDTFLEVQDRLMEGRVSIHSSHSGKGWVGVRSPMHVVTGFWALVARVLLVALGRRCWFGVLDSSQVEVGGYELGGPPCAGVCGEPRAQWNTERPDCAADLGVGGRPCLGTRWAYRLIW